MKDDLFLVYFVGGEKSSRISASTERDAIILACADRIRQAKHCRVERVENLDQGTQRQLDLTKESPFEINWLDAPEPACHLCGEDH